MTRANDLRTWETLSSIVAKYPLGAPALIQRGIKAMGLGGLFGLLATLLIGRILQPTYEASAQFVVGKYWLDKDSRGAPQHTLRTEVQIAKSTEMLRAAVAE